MSQQNLPKQNLSQQNLLGQNGALVPETIPRSKLRWIKELVIVAIFYLIYSYIRNQVGSNTGNIEIAKITATENAASLINLEKSIFLFVESDIQGWFIKDGVFSNPFFIRFWNFYYGITHFAVTIFAFVWAYVLHPKDFLKIRNVGLVSTGLALMGFVMFPVLPPRLLDEGYGFVDTIREFGGFLSFESGPLESISNQYAAMPSVHIIWALWCAYIFYPRIKTRILKVLAIGYPVLTLFAITVTANHYWIDAIIGLFVFILSYLIVTLFFPYMMNHIEDRSLGRKIKSVKISLSKVGFKKARLS